MKFFRRKKKIQKSESTTPPNPLIRTVGLFDKPFLEEEDDAPLEKVYRDGTKRIPAHRSSEGLPLIWTRGPRAK